MRIRIRVVGTLVVALGTLAGAAPAPAGATFDSVRCDPDCNNRVTTAQGPANEVTLAVDPTDPDNLLAAAKDYTLGRASGCGTYRVWAGIYHSTDGGRTWSNELLSAGGIMSSYACLSDPVLAFGPDGTAYFFALGLNPGVTDDLLVFRSDDGGTTWTRLPRIARNSDKQWAAVDQETGRIWLTWVDVAIGRIKLSRSDDRGATWSPVVFGAPVGTLLQGQGPAVAVGPGAGTGHGPVYLAWRLLPTDAIMVTFSVNGGTTWVAVPVAATTVSNPDWAVDFRGYRTFSMPSIAVNQGDGTIWIAFTALAQSRGEVIVAHSITGGLTWLLEIILDAGAVIADDFMPALAVASGGDVHVFYYTTADSPDGALGTLLDVRYAHGFGDLWDAPMRVTTVSSDTTVAYHQRGFRFIGDYIGAAASGDGAYGAWADMRNGRSDVYFAAIER